MDRLSSKTAKIRCVLMLGGFLVILMVLTRSKLVLAVTINLAFGRSDDGKISLMILGNRNVSLKTR